MLLESIPLRELTTAAGIAAAAVAIRQVIEVLKKTLWTALDAGNERKAAIIGAAVLYLLWLIFYGTDLGKDGPTALAAFIACATAAMGANEAVDAAKGTVAKNVGPGSDGDAENRGKEAAAGAAAVAGAGSASTGAGEDADDGTDRVAPLEEPPDADELNVNGGEPFDDEDADPGDDPADSGI